MNPPTMKNTKALLATLALLFALSVQTQAATLVLDSFSEGGFDLSDEGAHSDIDIFSGELLDRRRAVASAGGDFTAKLVTGSGVMNYAVELRGTPSGDVLFTLLYTKQDGSGFSLLGADGLSLKIVGLVGLGDLLVYLDGGSTNSVSIPITSTGDLFYPLANTGNILPLNDVHQIGFQLIAKSSDFSIELDQITVVPEPSATVLFGLVAWAGLFRRRRL